MPDIQEIFDEMMDSPTEEEKALITRAYEFAHKAHEGQERMSGEPYFNHVFATAKNLARFGMDTTTISAGFLHDVLEDTETSEEELEEKFSKDILFLVKGVTKLGKLKYRGRERHVESLRKFFVAVAEDFRVLMIKLSDRLHNLQTLEHVKPEKQKRIALEAIEVYAPLANRFGIGKLKGELEDAAFPFAFPKEYAEVKKIIKEKFVASQKHLEHVNLELKKKLEDQGVNVTKLDYRMKHLFSLYKKLLRYDMDIERVYDVMALRVIVKNVEDCYRVLGIVHSMWKPLPGRIKDYIAVEKLNGYQSLHTTIFTGQGGIVEIQIRTEEMHGRAEYGIASHFSYKEKADTQKAKEPHKFTWMKQLRDLQSETLDHEKFLENMKMDFFTDRIFIFTPKGDVIDLPRACSPIDFAYAIHSDIGDHCAQAKVNGKLVAIGSKLKSGDIVEIITKRDAHPTSKWLDYVKTAMARKHIKSYLNENSLLSKFLSFGIKK